jgi:hypothetical protein
VTRGPELTDPGDTKHGHRVGIGFWFNRHPDGHWTFEVDWSGTEYEYSYDYGIDANGVELHEQGDYISHSVQHTEMLDWLIEAAIDAGYLPHSKDGEEVPLPIDEDPLIRALR